MAQVISKPPSSNSNQGKSQPSQGEKTLLGILRDRLPDDFIVWHNPTVEGREPDFIIFGQAFGLLVIEVKGWGANQISEASQSSFLIQRSSNTEREDSPIEQGFGYVMSLKDRLKKELLLVHPPGEKQGKLVCPVRLGAVMSEMTEIEARNLDIYQYLEKPHVAYQDEMLAWKNLSAEELIKRLKRMNSKRVPFPEKELTDDQISAVKRVISPQTVVKRILATPTKLTDDQISTIRGVISPQTVVKRIPATSKSVPEGMTLEPGSSVLVTLDREQEKIARSLGDGHRLVSGVAGSGKTLILLSRAKMIADRDPNERVLILCFNITLASHLRSLLHTDNQNPRYKQIEVLHFNDWAKALLGQLPNPNSFDGNGEYDRYLGDRVLTTLQTFPLERRWDSVLVDEAHTFDASWFPCCVEALKDPQNGDLLIISDVNQSLYKRPSFTWSSVGIKARGRSKNLDQNYRNTQEILTAAWNIVKLISSKTKSGDDATFPVVQPSAALRRAKKPVLHLAASKSAAVNQLVHQIKILSESGYAREDIAIVYWSYTPTNSGLFTEMLEKVNKSGTGTLYWITQNRSTKANYSVKQAGVRVVTALSSLGLEFKAVLVLWADQFDDCCSDDSEKATLARRQLYVAMTRAQDELHLFGSGTAKVLEELQNGDGFEIVRK